MKNNILSILFLLLFLQFASCVEDTSTGLLNEINEVRIEGVEEEYRVMLYDKLIIEPEITALRKGAELSYCWYLNTPTTSIKADTLSHEKNLSIVMTPEIATPGNKYELTYKVTDVETGVFFTKVAKFDLMTQFTKGTLILCETDNQPVLHFLNKTNVNNYSLIENCYKNANGGNSMGANPICIYSLNPSDYKPQMREVMLCCKDSRGGAFLNPNTLRDHRSMNDAILFKPQENYAVTGYIKASIIDYLIVNGQVCKRAVNMGNMTWEAPMVSIDGEKSYHAVMPHMDIAGVTHFYDQKFGRLLAHEQWNKGALKRVGNNENDNTYFDINNLGSDMLYLCGGVSQLLNNYWMVLKNKNDQSVWVYRFLIEVRNNSKRFVSQSKTLLTSAIASEVKDALSYGAMIETPGVMIYATPKGIFSLDISTVANGGNAQVRLIDAAESNFEFTGFEMKSYKVEKQVNGVVESEDQLLIKAYIKDLSRNNKQGGFAEYEISLTGGLQASYISHRSGFCDRIIDLEEKYN